MTVMWVCAGVSALGAVMTAIFVRESGGRSLEEVDAESAVTAKALSAVVVKNAVFEPSSSYQNNSSVTTKTSGTM